MIVALEEVMRFKLIGLAIFMHLILAACTASSTTPPVTTQIIISSTLPPPAIKPTNPPPAPIPTSIVAVIPASKAVPAPTVAETPIGQEGNPMHNPVYLDQAKVTALKTSPPQFLVQITGSLPTPCHRLHYNTGKPDQDGKINIDLYSTADPNLMCAQVITPFTEEISLNGLPSGKYSVWVAGKNAGEISVP